MGWAWLGRLPHHPRASRCLWRPLCQPLAWVWLGRPPGRPWAWAWLERLPCWPRTWARHWKSPCLPLGWAWLDRPSCQPLGWRPTPSPTPPKIFLWEAHAWTGRNTHLRRMFIKLWCHWVTRFSAHWCALPVIKWQHKLQPFTLIRLKAHQAFGTKIQTAVRIHQGRIHYPHRELEYPSASLGDIPQNQNLAAWEAESSTYQTPVQWHESSSIVLTE